LPLPRIDGDSMYLQNVRIHVSDYTACPLPPPQNIITLMCGILLSSQEEKHWEKGWSVSRGNVSLSLHFPRHACRFVLFCRSWEWQRPADPIFCVWGTNLWVPSCWVGFLVVAGVGLRTPPPTSCHPSSPLAVGPATSSPLVLQTSSGHDLELVPSIFHRHNSFPLRSLLILSSHVITALSVSRLIASKVGMIY
jgi:hypothetical protein